MDMHPVVSYRTYDTYSKEQTRNIITFAQFEEGDFLSETRNNAESGDESDINYTITNYQIRNVCDRFRI